MYGNFIVAETFYKQKIFLDPHDVIGKTILQKGLYDKTGLYFIEKILSKLNASIIFDIGASIGNHALRMSQYCHTLYLFEPQPTLTNNLNKTADLNHITNWKILNIGLSDEERKLVFYKNLDSNIESSFVAELKGKNFVTEEALVCVGDEVVCQHSINCLDFMKIDVEGFEAKVILGLKKSIQKFRPIIFMEWDKQITKDQFHQYGLFHKVFNKYDVKAIIRNPKESSLFKKLQGKVTRFFFSGTRQRWVIGDFKPHLNYRHIILVPIEKAHVLDSL